MFPPTSVGESRLERIRHQCPCWVWAIYGWFTEGFATADLQEAKALLDALG
jgi:hypothetical protein